MTKKTKQSTLSILNRHQSQRIQRTQQQTQIMNLKNSQSSNHKKSIKKPQQQMQLIQRVELLQQKSQRFYKHTQKKIDKMIQIIQEIQNKKVNLFGNKINQEGKESHGNNAPLEQNSQKQQVQKTLNYLHNILTLQKPLSYIKHEFEAFYSKLSSFSKQLTYQKPLNDDKKFLLPEGELEFQEIRKIEELIKEHYLRQGKFQVAQLFNRYGKVEENSQQKQKVQQKQNKSQNQPNQHHNQKQQVQNLIRISTLKKQAKTKKKIKDQKAKKSKASKLNLSKATRPKVELIDKEQNFKQCFMIKNQILSKKFQKAIGWCVQQRLYQTYSNPLQYDLRITQIKILIHQKKFHLALLKLQQQSSFKKFVEEYGAQLNQLVGYLLFSCQWNPNQILQEEVSNNNNQPIQQQQQQSIFNSIIAQEETRQSDNFLKSLSKRYCAFHISTLDLNELADTFCHTYFIHYDISQFDSLQICYEVGTKYEEKYFSSIQMFSEKDKQEFLKHKAQREQRAKYGEMIEEHTQPITLPFEIPVQKQYMYHSLFVCPVTKEVLSSNDGVEYLSCGHLVSQSAKKNMAEVRRSNHKQKCPVCQKDRASDVVKVRF